MTRDTWKLRSLKNDSDDIWILRTGEAILDIGSMKLHYHKSHSFVSTYILVLVVYLFLFRCIISFLPFLYSIFVRKYIHIGNDDKGWWPMWSCTEPQVWQRLLNLNLCYSSSRLKLITDKSKRHGTHRYVVHWITFKYAYLFTYIHR